LTLDRNLADAYAVIGLAELIRGHPEQTETGVNEALRLSPRDNRANLWNHFVGAAKLHLGDDGGAVACFRRAIEINPNFSLTHFYLAAALALLGRREEARLTV
jgi:tetratricopeptide (TPR) repeat protein